MTTAIGQYISRSGAKLRMFNAGFSGADNDALIDSICRQVNDGIEEKTGRAVCPIPAYSSTFSASAGDQSFTVADIAGLGLQDDVLLGLLSGNHEDARVIAIAGALDADPWVASTAYSTGDRVQPTVANGHSYRVVSEDGTSDTSEPAWPIDGTVIDDNDLVWLDEGAAGAATVTLDHPLTYAYAAAPIQRIYVYDGFDALDFGRTLVVSRGLFALAAVEVATFTGAADWTRVDPRDYFLDPPVLSRTPGWPATELRMTNVPHVGGTTVAPVFYPGFRNVRLIGPGPALGMTLAPFAGWPAIPDKLTDIAAKLFVATFRERASSGGQTFTVNLDGSRVYERALSYEDKAYLERLRVKDLVVVDAGLYGWSG